MQLARHQQALRDANLLGTELLRCAQFEVDQGVRLLFDFTATMSALTLIAAERAREGGPDTPNVLTDEQIDLYHENLEGIAMYVSEYGRCRATLEARQKAEAARR